MIVLGDGLYRYNRSASAHFLSEINDCSGKVWTEAPCELKEDEEPGSTFRIIYGRLPMMRTMQDPEEKTLTIDGKEYLLLYKNPEMCYNTILSSKAVISEVKQSAAAYLFTEENEKDMERLLREKNLFSAPVNFIFWIPVMNSYVRPFTFDNASNLSENTSDCFLIDSMYRMITRTEKPIYKPRIRGLYLPMINIFVTAYTKNTAMLVIVETTISQSSESRSSREARSPALYLLKKLIGSDSIRITDAV